MKRIGSLLFILTLLVCMALSAGCSKPRVEMAVASQPNVNPDHSSRPSPVVVKIYELRNDLAFKQAEFITLFNTPLQVLGADLIATDELVFIPGEARRVAYQPNPNTRFVGIVAGFRQMDRALWRVIKPVDPEEENRLAIELNDATILVVPDKEAKDWDPEKAVRQFQQQLAKPQEPVAADAVVDPAQPGTMTAPPDAQPAPSPLAAALEDAAREAGTGVEQETKEVVTIINQYGVETFPNDQGLGTAPAAPSESAPSLPSMRAF